MTLAWLAAAWIAGTVAAATLGRGAWALALAVVLAVVAFAAARRDRRMLWLALALPLLFVASAARFETSRPRLAADAASRFNDGVEMRLHGVVRDDPDIGDTSQRFAVTVREVQLRGAWQGASGGVVVTTGLYPRYRSGDVLELEGQLETPAAIDGFDYADYLARKGILSTMNFPSARVVGHEDDNIVKATLLHVRRRLSRALELALPEPQSSLAKGVLLGRRSALPAELTDDLNTTNTSHLVVVSGSNVVLVSAFVALLFTWAVGRRWALLLSIVAVVAYAVLVGLSPPVMRGLIMGVLTVIATVLGRRGSAITALAFAAAIMVGVSPDVVRDVAFQLSFAATAGILYLSTPLQRWIVELAARAFRVEGIPSSASSLVAEPLAMSLAAIVATAPLLALNFGRVSLVAVPANMLVVPAFPFILGGSLLAAVGGMLPAGRLMLAAPAYYLLTYWIDVASRLGSLPGAAASASGFHTGWAVASYCAIAVGAVALVRFLREPPEVRVAADSLRLAPVAAIGLPAVALTLAAAWWFHPSAPRVLRVTVLDVGQGDAILIESPSGYDVLVDGGPGGSVLRGLGGELPWDDRSLDLMVLTHPQADHLNGLIDVLARYDVRRVIAGPGVQPSAAYDAWLDAVAAEGRTLEAAQPGSAIELGDGARLEILGPDEQMAMDREVNNTGVVARVVWGDVSFLLTADIEAKAERALLADGVDLRATVLKVGHHGSKTSSTDAFLAAVRPMVAAVSSGKDNRFGHPAPEVVQRLEDYAAVYNTAYSGAVHFETDGTRLWISEEQ